VVVAVLVAVTGITSRVAPPPTVAQFAPQAVKQIKKAVKDQSSRFGVGNGVGSDGRGPGAGPGGGPSAPPLPSPPPLPTSSVPVTHRCVGDPPRQIEDSQSPPCVAFWQGKNGGATWKGVTADTIRIAIPGNSYTYPGLQNFFNNRFEFYGRKLQLFNPAVSNSDVPQNQRNDAASVDSQKAFAATGYSYGYYFSKELARRHIVSATAFPYFTEGDLKGFAPYVWQYPMQQDKMWASEGAWLCNRLAGRKAFHAGDPSYTSQQRKFGVVTFRFFPELPLDATPLTRRMEGCGAKPAVTIAIASIGSAQDPAIAANTVQQLKAAGVNSVVCVCDWGQTAYLFRAATSQAYLPEWLLGTYMQNDSDYIFHTFFTQKEQLDHTVGLAFQPRELRPDNTPALWAYKEGLGTPPDGGSQISSSMYFLRMMYHELLLLASGIQMAGPILTPATFQAGLQRAVFPNPDLPMKQGVVQLDGDHAMMDDATEFYWNRDATSPYPDMAGRGAFCYVDAGMRHTVADWPKTEPPYGRMPCDSRSQ
jgi:hypothetical protein